MPKTMLASAWHRTRAPYAYLSASGGDSVGKLLPVGVQPPLGIFNAIDTGNGMGVPFGTWTIF